MPRGGARIGAGRKPKTARAHWLTGDAGKRNLAVVESPVGGDVVAVKAFLPPAALGAEERDYWRTWEPEARANGTLTSATVAGFVLLCEVAADAGRLRARIDADGLMFVVDGVPKAHPLLPSYRGQQQRREQLLARYGLAAMGKPAAPVSPVSDEKQELRRLLAIR
jgi:hypothetical protein